MLLRKNGKTFLILSCPASAGIVQPLKPRIHKESILGKQSKSLSKEEIRFSGILEVIAEVAEEIHQEYLDAPLTTLMHQPVLERELYESAVSRILDRSISLKDIKGESSMDHETVIAGLKPYATSIRTEEYSFGSVVYVISLHELEILLNSDDSLIIVNCSGRCVYSYEDTSYLKAILLLDAARDVLRQKLQKLLLEIKAMISAQEIYLKYAGTVADAMTVQYRGKTRVSNKADRTTLHFYLSDTEKAVITFFKEKMPWRMPEPPTDPESLRETCQEEGSPFFIVSLSKKDRRLLKSHENE